MQFKKLSSISLFHSYFNDGKAKALKLQPKESTKNILQKCNLVFRQEKNVFILYRKEETNINDLLTTIIDENDIEFLEFEIHSEDNDFQNYTDIPLYWKGEFMFLNKSDKNKVGDNSIILEPNKVNDVEVDYIGVVMLDVREMFHQVQSENANFEIYFEARKTQWNYFVIHQNPEDILAIKSDSGIDFSGPTAFTLPDGSRASKFSSGDKLIPLKENYDFNIELLQEQKMQKGDSIFNVVIPSLPAANKSKIDLLNSDEGQVFTSNLYIYF